MRTAIVLVLVGATGLCASMPAAQACGEAMYRVGGALRHHVFVTRHPARILLYAGPGAAAGDAQPAGGFPHDLERAGHTVDVIADPQALAAAVASHAYDVIITLASNLDAVDAALASAARAPSLIPVYGRDADGDAFRARYPLALREDSGLNRFLSEIEDTMKARGA